MEKKRKWNFELLRIVSMVMIIILHYWGKSTYLDTATIEMPGFYIGWFFKAICLCSVNCYVLLSGYFLIDKPFKPSRILKVWAEVEFYSVMILFITSFIRHDHISIMTLIRSLLPITTESYWYVTVYILLLVISPILNFYIEKCDKKQLRTTCIILVTVFSVLPTILCYNDFTNIENGYSLLWFVSLYIIAAYIRKYGIGFFENSRNRIISFVASFGILFFSKIVIHILSVQVVGEEKYTNLLFRYNSIFTLTASVSLFCIFKNINITNKHLSKMISTVAPSTFGVYLIHLHPSIKEWFWRDIINPMQYDTLMTLMGNFVITVSSVFIICAIVDIIRIKTIEKPVLRLCIKIDDLFAKKT